MGLAVEVGAEVEAAGDAELEVGDDLLGLQGRGVWSCQKRMTPRA
jgi:hypothetical protein